MLIVTPQYLERQKIVVEPEIENKIIQLNTGEFVLLLPERLRSIESEYKTVFENNITDLVASGDTRQEMTATVAYLNNGNDRFVYNVTPMSYQQFIKDPIIIVLTPQSTGEQAFSFWDEVMQEYFFFNNLRDAQTLVEEYGLENWVSEFQLGYHIHQNLLNNIQRKV